MSQGHAAASLRRVLFFKRILKFKKDTVESDDKRITKRYPVAAKFPLNAKIALAARDDVNTLKPTDGKLGMDWGGQIINLSTTGASIRLHPAAESTRNEPCRLKLELKNQVIEIDGVIAHFYSAQQYSTCGVQLKFQTFENKKAYLQLLEPVAIGAGLTAVEPDQVEQTVNGLTRELYAGYNDSVLNVWRDSSSNGIEHFELQMSDYLIRGSAQAPPVEVVYRDCVKVGDKFSYLAAPIPVKPAEQAEVRQLFEWIVLSMGKSVPAEVRAFLQRFVV